MFKVEVDKAKNLVRNDLAGRVPAAEAERCLQEFRGLVPDLRPGFALLTDMSQLETMDFGCTPFIQQIMDLLNQHGIERVVRIIPDPHKDIGFSIMSLFHYRKGVRIVTCATVEEAERVLAS